MTRFRSVMENLAGRIAIGTDRTRDAEAIGGRVRVQAWEAIVIET